MKPLETYDYLGVYPQFVQKVEQIYANDQWMSFIQIAAESQVSAYLFNWTQIIIEVQNLYKEI